MLLLPLILLLLSILLWLFYHFSWKRRHLPPGPTPLPIIGNVTAFSGDQRYSAFQQWSRQYGPVYTIWISEHPIVIVTDYEVLKDTFIKDGDTFSGRDFLNEHFRLYFGQVDGIIRTQGEQWKQMRKFMFKSMREYGLERESMELQVLQAIKIVMDEADQEIGSGLKEHSLDRKVDQMTGSIINRMLFGYGFYGDRYKDFVSLKKMLDFGQEYFISLTSLLIEASPWLRHLPYFSRNFKTSDLVIKNLFAFGEKEIEKRIENRKDPEYFPSEGKDILDQFLDEMENSKQQDDMENYIKIKYLPAFLFDIFLAGQETTSNTINFMIYYLMMDQRVQQKLQAELDKAAEEKNTMPEDDSSSQLMFRLSDRTKLNFANAVAHETQRFCNLLPLNLTRLANRDVEICGFKIPKGTTMIPQISTILYDNKIFPDPLSFKPERFLDENGQFKKIEEFFPFGVGKRICPGEALARMELFLFATNFFYKYHVYPPDPLNPPKPEKRQTFAVKLDDYKCHIAARG